MVSLEVIPATAIACTYIGKRDSKERDRNVDRDGSIEMKNLHSSHQVITDFCFLPIAICREILY